MSFPATVSTFRLDAYEVTVGRFREFVNAGMGTQANPPAAGAGGRALNGMAGQGGWDPAWNANLVIHTGTLVNKLACDATLSTWTDTPGGNENRPINCISWYEASAFCAWDGGFLPTDAEWNHAAAGGSEQRAYPWSSPPSSLTNDDATYASYYVDAIKECYGDMVSGCAVTDLVPVGTKPAGVGRWGQSDLGGNVWEWTLDWFASPYAQTPCADCANLTPATYRVIRGGSLVKDVSGLRTGFRAYTVAPNFDGSVGARCARRP